METITNSGFSGDNWFLAGHSLGGVMTQDWIDGTKNGWFDGGADPSVFKGQILMSSTLLRNKRSI
jgi:alpha-beta hydrolase superfamily lysophospholipase